MRHRGCAGLPLDLNRESYHRLPGLLGDDERLRRVVESGVVQQPCEVSGLSSFCHRYPR